MVAGDRPGYHQQAIHLKGGDRLDWIETYTGKKVKLLSPDPSEINIEDIAHGLSRICRFSGQCKHFYSVAQHSLNMAIEMNNRRFGSRLVLLALLHDASEAYIGDVPRPVKQMLLVYHEIEKRVQSAIWKGIGIDPPSPFEKEVIKRFDDILLGYEAKMLMGCRDSWNQKYLKDELLLSSKHFDYCNPAEIEYKFLSAFASLTSPQPHIRKDSVSS